MDTQKREEVFRRLGKRRKFLVDFVGDQQCLRCGTSVSVYFLRDSDPVTPPPSAELCRAGEASAVNRSEALWGTLGMQFVSAGGIFPS